MVQKLFIKKRTPDGGSERRQVTVLRSWQEAGGAAVYFHKNGVYGYKDGAPVRSLAELSVIATDPPAFNLAKKWWAAVGAKMSAEYYAAKDAELEELAQRSIGAAGGNASGDNTSLDMVQYIRRPIKDRRRQAFSDPSTWSAFFDQRPDWWGAAGVIEIGEYRYEMVQADPDEEGAVEDDGVESDASGSGRSEQVADESLDAVEL